MHIIYETSEKCRDFLTTPTATIPETGFRSDRSYECAYKIFKFLALPVPGIISGTLKLWAVPEYAIQGHPKSLISVPIESAYAIS